MCGGWGDMGKRGGDRREVILHRQQQGTFVGDVDSYCAMFLDPKGGINETVTSTPDGRTMRLIYKRSPDGGWATTLEDVTENRRAQAKIEHLAHYDPLTNLPNRTLFQRHAEGLLLETDSVQFAILYIDIDEFKAINDSLGHLIGGEFLKAVAEGQFEISSQPLVDLKSDEVTGCEALLRWGHPVRGMVSPADFIPVAEETGLIEEIGQWVLRTACAEAATWPAHVRIAVNVSPIQFRSETLSLKVAAALAETGLDPRRLELEITEAVLIADDDAALATLNQLRGLGVHIALDDFGTGYSSLQYLQRFPFDKIKIDRSFVKEVVRNSSAASIIRAVVSIRADRDMITPA